MGSGRAALAVEAAVLAAAGAGTIISAGFAGACDPGLHVGDIVRLRTVVETRTGERFASPIGSGVLASTAAVAGAAEKTRLWQSYGASAVDMEAATVARLARGRGMNFEAIKVISDEAEFELGDMTRFVTNQGAFREVAFGLHMAMRPSRWGHLRALARSSRTAQVALEAAVRNRIEEEA
jgi:adenosylhomocysteine nucleosidase